MLDARLLAEISVLAAVAEAGSFTQAGRLLGLTPSGVSRAVSRLEQRIGVRLLDRTTRSLRLTSEGARLHALSRPHLSGLEEAASSAGGAAVAVSGRLRVSVNPIVARHILAPNLPLLAVRHPDLSLVMVPGETGDLTAGGIDAAIRFGLQPSSTMSSRHLLDTRVLTVAAPDYLAWHGRPAAPADLLGRDCLHYLDPQRGRAFDWEFHRDGTVLPVATRGRYTFTDVDTMIAAACAGTGIAQVLALSVGALLAQGMLVELFSDWPGETFPLYAIRPSRRLPTAAVEAFVNFCVEICEDK